MAKLKRKDALPSMSRNTRGIYQKDCGWKGDAEEGYRQQRFYLGDVASEALIRAGRLEEMWETVETLWTKGGRKTPRAVWDDNTLAIAQAVAKGEQVVKLQPPPMEVYEELASAEEVSWLRELQQLFPMVRLTLDNEAAQQAGEEFWAREARELEERAALLRRKNTRQTLYQALDAFAADLPNRQGYTRDGVRSETCEVALKDVAVIKAHSPDLRLGDLDRKAMERMETYWYSRPMGKRGKLSAHSCDNYLKRLRMFFKWLKREKAFDWTIPDDYEPVRGEFIETDSERARRANTRQVSTFRPEELALLWKHGRPLQRLMLLLGVNCGFGIAEMATLQISEMHLDTIHEEYGIKGSFIFRIRKKNGVYGQHRLWAETVEGLKWYISQRPETKETCLLVNSKGAGLVHQTSGGNRARAIPNCWNQLTARVRKLEGETACRTLSVNKLRKTGINLVRKVSDGETAGVMAHHGKPVKTDALLDVYSDRDFTKVFAAQEKARETLADVFASVPDPWTVPVRKLPKKAAYVQQRAEVMRLRDEGKTYDQIAEELGTSRRVVAHHVQSVTSGEQRKKKAAREKDKQLVLSLHRMNLPVKDIAERTGISLGKCYYYISTAEKGGE